MQLTVTAPPGTMTSLEAGWPGEMYQATSPCAAYTGGAKLSFVENNLVLAVRYVWIVSW